MTSDRSATETSKVHPSLLLLLMHYDLNIANLHATPAARVCLAVLTAAIVLSTTRLVFRQAAGSLPTLNTALLLDTVSALWLAREPFVRFGPIVQILVVKASLDGLSVM